MDPPTTPRPQATGKSPPYLRAGPLPVVNPMSFLGLQRMPSTGFLQTLRLDLKTKFCAQESAKEGPSRPQTFPNGAQIAAKTNFYWFFVAFVFQSEFSIDVFGDLFNILDVSIPYFVGFLSGKTLFFAESQFSKHLRKNILK